MGTITRKSTNAKRAKNKSKTGKKSWVGKLWLRYKALNLWRKILAWVVMVLAVFVLIFFVSALTDRLLPPSKNPQYGVSFSVLYAKELGVNWQDNLLALMDQLHIKRYRFMTYWETVEQQPGVYDFSQIDWQMEQAAKRGYTVSLSIGLRQPRWPECHQPDWATKLSTSDHDQWQKELFDYISQTVNRYKNNPALQSYQLENEAVNSWFGVCGDMSRQRLNDEFNLVKGLDPNHPVYMSLSDEHGFPFNTPVPDAYGFSEYRIVWNNKTGPFKFYMTYPAPAWFHRVRAFFIKEIKHRDSFVHELQMEPWGPVATVNMSIADQNKSMSTGQMKKSLVFARKTDLAPTYMWGGEWWYWRKTVLGDSGPWDVISSEIQQFPN